MIFELSTLTGTAGSAARIASDAGTIGRQIRGDDYGVLEGCWVSEIGPLNQVLQLWRYQSLDERKRLQAALAADRRWNADYLPLLRERLVREDVRLMSSVVGPVAPASRGNLFELRYYRLRSGGAAEWVPIFMNALPAREKYSKIVGLFTTDAGQPDEVCHLWAYPDLNARAKARGDAIADPEWAAFLKRSGELKLPQEMASMILLPAAHSPLA